MLGTKSWVLVGSLAFSGICCAEVVSSSATHFELKNESTSILSPSVLWERLIDPRQWWHPDHTYSGSAENLRLELKPGGLWAEHWEGGSVSHGTVLDVKHGSVLLLNAPFGPLQELGVSSIWTITITPDGDGAKVIFYEVAKGPPTADMASLAVAVDGVKAEGLRRLVSGAQGN